MIETIIAYVISGSGFSAVIIFFIVQLVVIAKHEHCESMDSIVEPNYDKGGKNDNKN